MPCSGVLAVQYQPESATYKFRIGNHTEPELNRQLHCELAPALLLERLSWFASVPGLRPESLYLGVAPLAYRLGGISAAHWTLFTEMCQILSNYGVVHYSHLLMQASFMTNRGMMEANPSSYTKTHKDPFANAVMERATQNFTRGAMRKAFSLRNNLTTQVMFAGDFSIPVADSKVQTKTLQRRVGKHKSSSSSSSSSSINTTTASQKDDSWIQSLYQQLFFEPAIPSTSVPF
jgi:hypothetical protein